MSQDFSAFLLLAGYYAAFAAALGLLAKPLRLSHELLRKLYHMSCGLSIFILLFAFATWQGAVLGIIALLMAGHVLLLIGGRIPMTSERIDRGSGIAEIREHLLLMLLAMVLLLIAFWGMLGSDARYAAAVGFLAWGFGDASASLVGGRFATRRFQSALFDTGKSPLGSTAMMLTVTLTTILVLALMTPLSFGAVLLCAVVVGMAAALTEAVTRRGLDTLTVPLVAGAVCYPVAQCLQPGLAA